MDDLSVDLSINFANRSSTLENVTNVIQTINELPESKILEAVDPIIGGGPFDPNSRVGFAIADNSNYTLSPFQENANPDYVSSFGFGITADYLNRRNSPFTVIEALTQNIENNQVWISQSTAIAHQWNIGDMVNISYGYGLIDQNFTIPIGDSLQLQIAGFVDIDLGLFIENIEAYVPELQLDDEFLSLITFQSISADMFFMDWQSMLQLTANYTYMRGVYGIHLSLDSQNLGADIDDVERNLLDLEITIATEFPELIINNFAIDHLELVADKVQEFRLFMLYFSLPGLFLGIILTVFVIGITSEERFREIHTLQLRGAKMKKILAIIGMEILIISIFATVIGFILGLVAGSILLSSIETTINLTDYQQIISNLSTDSIQTAIVISVILSISLSLGVVRKFAKIEIIDLEKTKYHQKQSILQQYNLDFLLGGMVLLVLLADQQQFNPIPSFAKAIYSLIIPLFVWITLSLLTIRLTSGIMRIVIPLLIKATSKFSNPSWIAIFKSLNRNKRKISLPLIIIVLTLSIVISLDSTSKTFVNQASLEAKFAVGSDIRIQLPGPEQLNFKTDDLHQAIEQIDGIRVTDAFITVFNFGGQPSLILAINPGEFLEFSYFQDDFFFYNSPKNTLTTLNNTIGGLGWIISFDLGFPFADGLDDLSKGPPIFEENETIPFRFNFEDYEIRILDVAIQFPGIGDLTGRPADELPYLIVDRRFLVDPLANQEVALIPEIRNSTHFFVDVDESIISTDEAIPQIEKIYEEFDSPYFLDFRTTEDYKEEFYELGDLFIGMNQIELVISFIIIILTLFLYTTSELQFRRSEYAILHGIGWNKSAIARFTSIKLWTITILSITTSIPIGLITFNAYLPLLTDLFLFSVEGQIISFSAMLIASQLLMASVIGSIILNYLLISRLNVAETLREG